MIKLVLVIAIVFVVIWFMRGARSASRRGDAKRQATPPPSSPPVQQEMVECPVCRVHLPRSDALPGPGGQLYCCAEHRQNAAG